MRGLVRAGAAQASVTASFAPPAGHPAAALLGEQGLDAEDDIVLRRVLAPTDARAPSSTISRSASPLLRRVGALLVEIQGQHEQMGLADPASHAALLDAFGVPPALRRAVAEAWRGWRAAVTRSPRRARPSRRRRAMRNGCATRCTSLARWPPRRTRRSASPPNASVCNRASAAPRRSPPRSPS